MSYHGCRWWTCPACSSPGRAATRPISIAFFHQPTYDARIECIPTCTSPDDPPHYEPTTSGGWILSMTERTLY